MTALSGGNMSEESFAMSTAIFASPYAAFQTDSLDDPGSSSAASVELQDGKAIDRATALDEAASALRSLAGRNVASSCLMYSTIGDAGVGGRPFAGVDDERALFRN